MDWNAVAAQLARVPATYKRSGTTFEWLSNSFTMSLLRYSSAADGISAQLVFQNAIGTWLDVWGQLLNVRRKDNEADDDYRIRIQFLLGFPPASLGAQGGKGTPISMENYITYIEGVGGRVAEAFPAPGYQIYVGALTAAAYAQLLNDLKYVRPAGVPFEGFVSSGGTYLDTVNYLGAPKITGAYLLNPFTPAAPPLSATTNNSAPLLPTTFLTDPTINPSLAA
jgi:hypothetical protein